ncbi:efflux RND transporter periplasmic adaptor subunit [Arenibacterium halophilum]|uniref:Efflux RND transporter periplasmic adaptor subunit n=1 Tax=Arenibacterium halophilum TaxID=2583821 RepID=A0ABY2XAV0_9RHOB|nr:efflux RND transporter periplasmic adaptor subunit [Arenibacterium halophilum]TMV13178.1 efflux RND transporter periplasmic adaptor subunit [Arenibacterium halophilum]
MYALRQIILGCALLAVGLYVWIAYVPAALPFLNRVGLLDLLGIEAPQAQDAGPQRGSRPDSAARVVTERVGERVLADNITAIGNGRARRSVSVRANAEGTVTDLALEAGQYVESGTVIVQLQDQAEQIALERAQIELKNSVADSERITQLAATGAVTEVRMLETELALRSAELAVRQAEFDLSERQIRAPISGSIGIIDLEVGDRVSPQDILVTITDRSDILIDFRVPERVVGKIAIGQSIDVTPLGLSERPLVGEVAAIDAVVDRASRTLLVRGRVSNEQDMLRDGMAFSVSLSFPGETLLSVAPLALRWSSTGPHVWAVRDGVAEEVPVAIVQRNTDAVLVTSDSLKPGDMIVTEGVQTLRAGSKVTPVAKEEEAASAGLLTAQGARL